MQPPCEEPRPRPGANAPQEPRPYEPPRLVRLGSLHRLLGKTGTRFDNPDPHFRRP